jgi:hypothetical protein
MLDHAMERSHRTSHRRRLLHAHSALIGRTALAAAALLACPLAARGPLPRPRRGAGQSDLAAVDIARQNELRLRLGWRAFHSGHGADIGALAPEKFRALTAELVQSVAPGR